MDGRYRLLVDAITDYAIYMLDRDGTVSSWNPGAQRFKGYTAQEIVGHHFSRFYTDEDRATGLPARGLATAAREGRFETEGWRVRKDGSRMWAHVVIDAVRDTDGGVIGFAKVTRDITERREAQRALEKAQHALFQSQKLEAIGQLTGGVAHDFNNLLMAIMGSLELLQKRLPDDPKAASLLQNAMQGARRGADLTQRLLAFARKQELEPLPVDVAELAHGMAGLLQRSIGPTVRIRYDFPGGLPPVLTDPNQLETALLNLAVNARDAMPDGGAITLSARPDAFAPGVEPDGGMGYVCLSVTDTGEGMDEDTLSRALEPFFTTKGVGKGTGLGLSMVHGLAEQSGAKLAISSRPGEGTRIDIWLPFTAPAKAADPVAPGPLPATPRPLTILAVDDDDLVLMNTAAMLEDMGHTVLQADSAAAALELVRAHGRIDLLISDQAVPGMTGVQLAEAMAHLRPGVPVILATGYAELPPGTDPSLHRLAKPFTQVQLAAAVATISSPVT